MRIDKTIQAVIFDLDGVVCFTDHYHYLAWKELTDSQGWRFDEELNHKLRGIPRLRSLEIILKHNNVDLPVDKQQELATEKNETFKDKLQAINSDDLYPEIIPLIKQMRQRGFKIGLGSSSRNAELVLDKLGIANLFDAVVTGNDIEKAKPEPEVFLRVADLLGVEPEACLVFEDAESGVEAALRAGMQVVGVGTPELLPGAPQTLIDFSDITFE